jgi:hypothetical protein
MIVWNTGNDAHSLSVLSWDGALARTANYGAGGMSPSAVPGAKIVEAPLSFNGKVWRYGKTTIKTVQRVIRLEDMIPTFTVQALLDGPDYTDVYTGEVRDLVESYAKPPG